MPQVINTVKLIVPLLSVLLLTGCGKSGPQRAPISGTITFGAAPLKAGRILFVPDDGPAVSARIVDGQYKLPAEEGPVVGANRVEVEADLPVSFALDDEAAMARAKGRLPRQPVPSEFNRASTLVVEVQPDAENRFDVAIPAAAPYAKNGSR